jgi:Family of unknown function (DUF5719)
VIVRRIPMLAVTVAAAAATVTAVVATDDPAPSAPTFAAVPEPWMPAVPTASAVTSTWFCPGVPATGAAGTAGEIVVANAGTTAMTGRITFMAGEGKSVLQPLSVAPNSRAVVSAAASLRARYVSAVIEIDGGGGLVEQRATQDAGSSVAPCSTDTSAHWYLAEGFTSEQSNEQLVLSNPFDQSVIVDIGFATKAGSRQPPELQGYPIPPRSVQVIDLDSIAARDEAQVAVSVVATKGTLVVGRAQVYKGGGRLGYSMTLASPTLRSQWWFVNGSKGPGISERFSIYNPSAADVQVQPLYLGVPDAQVSVDPIDVPAGEVVTFASDRVPGLPDGRHAVVFDSVDFSQSLVVERAVTRTIDDVPTTSVLLGAVSRPDGVVPTTWTLAVGPGEPTNESLIVYNSKNEAATVTVQAVTPSGLQNVPGLQAVPLPAAGLVAMPLTDPSAINAQLVVRSTTAVFVERSLPREPGAKGRTTTWAVPVA